MKTSSLVWAHLLFLFVNTAASSPYQNHEDIRQAVREFIFSEIPPQADTQFNLRVKLGTIDNRLQFSQCSQELNPFLPKGSRLEGRTTIGIRCDDEKPWRFYLPVAIQITEKVVIVSRRIAKGEILAINDLTLRDMNTENQRASAFTAITDLVGTRVKRTLSRNQVITPHHICTICKGDKVRIVAKSNQINVEMSGSARQDGVIGDLIIVENSATKRKIEGKILRIGLVEVSF